MIKRELGIFLIVGMLTVLVDYLFYRGLFWIGVTNVPVSKAIGFLSGTLFAYFVNRFWTFGHMSPAPGSWWRFGLLYMGTLGANVMVNSWAHQQFSYTTYSIQLAFFLATSVSASLNFLGMKFLVFKTKTISGVL